MTTLYDIASRKRFAWAVHKICGARHPPRSRLNDLGRDAAQVIGRPAAAAWTGAHLYVLLNFQRRQYQRYGINPDLLYALELLASNSRALHRTEVITSANVLSGSLVLARSRVCACKSCRLSFVPRTGSQRYHSRLCAERERAKRRRKQAKR